LDIEPVASTQNLGLTHEIDISALGRKFGYLRIVGWIILFGGGSAAIALAVDLILSVPRGNVVSVALNGSLLLFFSWSAYIAWLNVGDINPRLFTKYLTILVPVLITAMLVLMTAIAILFYAKHDPEIFQDRNFASFATLLPALVVAIGAAWAIFVVQRLRTSQMGYDKITLRQLFIGLEQKQVENDPKSRKFVAISSPVGWTCRIIGIGFLILAISFDRWLSPPDWWLSPPDWWLSPPDWWLSHEPNDPFLWMLNRISLSMVGIAILVRSRRYFQATADDLLRVDDRRPILLLRSFGDDENELFVIEGRKLLDFSLETRLSNYFKDYGPFIAIGSPRDPLPQIGAARAKLSSTEWQNAVMS
jgi:hypothetical protein